MLPNDIIASIWLMHPTSEPFIMGIEDSTYLDVDTLYL
jgi:hypothetical protein